ncbi:CLUMA_CG015512, isoform A [Clunio marinus]|uniref:CLUMA_CG015512, isoform A n=1 Tax=Clunio marinus TaxID=568069 RepID=A0A1J1IV82_9DIPT|nr:CLUMA_CG015512, isoform A [Clunio marinus]
MKNHALDVQISLDGCKNLTEKNSAAADNFIAPNTCTINIFTHTFTIYFPTQSSYSSTLLNTLQFQTTPEKAYQKTHIMYHKTIT